MFVKIYHSYEWNFDKSVWWNRLYRLLYYFDPAITIVPERHIDSIYKHFNRDWVVTVEVESKNACFSHEDVYKIKFIK